ncbi:hypothetical protein [Streptomyces sp. NPDC056227]|uniref:hypothetical protein n=1 Tax=Streptomyces sp. NPDC056227 TaxID=3345753 RepID=UPI0035D8E581
MADVVRPGKVDWTGDNPFIYLKTDPAGDWSALSLFFRVTASDFGPGSLVLTIEDPYDKRAEGADVPAPVRLALTDNEPLARFLIDGFVRRFVLFRPATAALDALELVGGAAFTTQGDGATMHTESARAEERGLSLAMTWEDLGTPFAVDVPGPQSGTGQHEMFSVFRTAGAAHVTVNDAVLPGSTVERDFLNGPAQSAALALSETWVRDGGAEVTQA